MVIYLSDFNNVLCDVKEELAKTEQFTSNPREADIFVLWQDVRREMAELCRINSEVMHKPVVVIQHGRGATRDYLPPNNFKMYADKFCCWGIKEKERLDRAGYGDRAVITGSPLIRKLRPRDPDCLKENNLVFCPVITTHEEPENILTFLELKRIEYAKAQEVLRSNFDKLKEKWAAFNVNPEAVTDNSIPYYNLNRHWRVISKITSAHDMRLYFGDVVRTMQQNKTHVDDAIKLLTMTGCVVGMEEGTFQLLAMAMNIPIVMVEGFQYKNFGGIDYSQIELIRTDAVRWTDFSNIEKVVTEEFKNPDALKEQREKVVKEELGDLNSDPVLEIVKVIKETYGKSVHN
ncbi:MAG: hypothetical protein WC444_07290 [Candidatus Paceibacterota bacterium]